MHNAECKKNWGTKIPDDYNMADGSRRWEREKSKCPNISSSVSGEKAINTNMLWCCPIWLLWHELCPHKIPMLKP